MGLLLLVVANETNSFVMMRMDSRRRFFFIRLSKVESATKIKLGRPKKRKNGGKTSPFVHIGVGLFIRSYRPKHDTSSLPNDGHADS
jgi:hypothetical protein